MTATPAAATTLMTRLREETRPNHTAAEQHALQRDMVSGRLSREAYARYLARLHRVHEALERAIVKVSDRRITSAATPNLFQTANFEADLSFYGAAPVDLAGAPATRAVASAIDEAAKGNPVRLLGFFYVLEGSKNGSRYIAKAVRRSYNLASQDGLRALDPHGEAQPALWAAFRARVDANEWTESERDQVVDAAKAMFDAIVAIADETQAGAG